MIVTKRYEYMPFEKIKLHPDIGNHRTLNNDKANHYEHDIMRNGLLEPLMVWEKNQNEFYLVGGFHRMVAIYSIRQKNPGYFDRVDVRVVDGSIDEMRALNLKLNVDRVDVKITDFFDTIVYLNNVNWEKEKIADFLGKSVSWVEDIIRFVPSMDARLRKLLEEGKLSWNKTRTICREILNAPAGKETETLERIVGEIEDPGKKPKGKKRPLTIKKAKKRLHTKLEKDTDAQMIITTEDLYSLLSILDGKHFDQMDLDRVQKKFPFLIEEK